MSEERKEMTDEELESLRERVVAELKTVYDPEIPVDIWELGLVYELKFDREGNLVVIMTLTTPNCPVAESLPTEVRTKARRVPGVKSAEVRLVWEPPWNQEMLSDEARIALNL
jgi:FeS assembly SUF system protein